MTKIAFILVAYCFATSSGFLMLGSNCDLLPSAKSHYPTGIIKNANQLTPIVHIPSTTKSLEFFSEVAANFSCFQFKISVWNPNNYVNDEENECKGEIYVKRFNNSAVLFGRIHEDADVLQLAHLQEIQILYPKASYTISLKTNQKDLVVRLIYTTSLWLIQGCQIVDETHIDQSLMIFYDGSLRADADITEHLQAELPEVFQYYFGGYHFTHFLLKTPNDCACIRSKSQATVTDTNIFITIAMTFSVLNFFNYLFSAQLH